MNPFILLLLAIVCETIGSAALRASNGFSQLWPLPIVAAGFAGAFFFLALTLKQIPLGTSYAIWSGVGTVATAIVSYLIWHEEFTLPKFLGIGLIIAGVVVINLFTTSPAA